MSLARMAKLVDAPASGAGTVTGMEVRVLFRAPTLSNAFFRRFFYAVKNVFRCFLKTNVV